MSALAKMGLRVVALGVVGLLGCATSARREARGLIGAFDRYRHASSAVRAAEAQAVSDVACSDARVCDAKRACLLAIEPTTHALALKDEVARGLEDVEQKRVQPDAPEARALPGKLDQAEQLLREGQGHMSDCEKRLNDLELEYGL